MIGLLVKGNVPEIEASKTEIAHRTGIAAGEFTVMHKLSKEHETFMTVPDEYDSHVARWFGRASCAPYSVGELLFFIRDWQFAER